MKVAIGKGIELDARVQDLFASKFADDAPRAVEMIEASPALAHVIYIGLKNILQDAHAGESDTDAARAKSEKKLAALMSGEVRVGGTREGDPVKAEMRRIAGPMAQVALMKKHGLKKRTDLDGAELRAVVTAIIESPKYGPDLRAKAEKAIADRAGLAVDVDELDI